MKKFILYIILFIYFPISGIAQQDPQYSHYMFNSAGINPGYIGMNGQICANIISHDQWLGWENTPKTRSLTLDMPLNILGGGIGLSMFSDNLGFEKNFTAKLGYSYHKSLGAGTLGIGVDAGIFNKEIETGKWIFPEQAEIIFSEITHKMVLDVSAGVFYIYENISAGFSATHLNRAHLLYTASGDFQMKNHFILTASYNIQLANALIDLNPSFLIKSDLVSTQYDINLLLLYNKKIWGGVTYRNNDALVFFAGSTIYNNIKLGLAYDLTTSRIQTVSNGTFEVYVGYCFDFIKPIDVKQYRSVRFL
jgi:type IX secretion system PorP/SprF family membrane protein